MKLKTVAFIQIVLLLLMTIVPSVVMADSLPELSLNKTSVTVGTKVTASGTTKPEAWVPLKVVDNEGKILVFDVIKADENGNYNIDFVVPEGASGNLTVVVGEGSQVAVAQLTVKSGSSDNGGSGGGGGGGDSKPEPVESTTGEAKVNPKAGGTISLDDEATIDIPAGALAGASAVEVKIEKASTIPEVSSGFKVLGNVYKITVDGKDSYTFNKKITLTFTFNPEDLGPGEVPSVYYYDEEAGEWVNIGGKISGNKIIVEIDHFTLFAVMTVVKTPELILTDIIGHWAENNIRVLVGLGAVSGYPDNTFKPDNNITRAEFATILVKAFELSLDSGKVFADTADHWAREYISTAAYHGIVTGYDASTFGPNDLITREQMAVMIVRATQLDTSEEEIPFTDSERISAWAKEAVAAAVKNGIISGYPDNTVRPRNYATRAEAATILVNALQVE
ncbi:MAG: S-layer homology domain-containing protein [Tepidanaerobacteraceae bacterium]|jgi:hypothetical protein